MSQVVHRYELKSTGITRAKLPLGYQVLTVNVNNSILSVWVLVDTTEETILPVTFLSVETGEAITGKVSGVDLDMALLEYIGSAGFSMNSSGFIVHVFQCLGAGA